MYKYKILIFILLLITGCNSNNVGQKNRQENNPSENAEIAGEEFNDFLFVGMVNKNSGIYKYDVNKEDYSVFWSKRYEKVVKLYYSENRRGAFFITARNSGRSGALPFVNNIKIYLINVNTGIVKYLTDIGSGIQVFTGWDTKNSFKVCLNYIDKKNPDYIHQRNIFFDITGQKILDEIKTFNITKEGYPKPEELEQNITNGEYKIFSVEGDLNSLFLVNLKNNDTTLITTVNQKLNEINWSKDKKILIFSTIKMRSGRSEAKSDSGNSKLIIYSLEDKKILKIFEGDGVKNFFIVNNWVIFDNGFGENSHINIYNFINLEMIKKISVRGGCGLQNIPQGQSYSA